MMHVVCSSPFIPPEWIAAHRMHPRWLPDLPGLACPTGFACRGVCRCADLLLAGAWQLDDCGALVLTTICDQMRYAAAFLHEGGQVPVFLFNVPSTWQNIQVRQIYQEELFRLSRFLVSLGGSEPSLDFLRLTMMRYEAARSAARCAWPPVSGGRYAEWLAALRNEGRSSARTHEADGEKSGARLALIGGPLLRDDFRLFELLAAAGGRVVLDASEWGERTLAAPLDRARVASDPVKELARVYFDEIPDVFRRPNTRLYAWLGEQIASRHVRGILFWRRVFCDLWHAELDVLRRWSPVPVLDIDIAEGDGHATARTLSRLEAFLEMLP